MLINTNLDGVYNVTKNALSIIRENGRIINISSIAGLLGNFGQTNYAASKAGIIGFTKSLAKELGKQKITVNAVAPGFIETQMTKSISFLRKKIMMAMIPLGRAGLPQDVANAVAFLASDKACYITGEVICVDGGLAF
ncbi:MAG: SDR family oxidoreductase [Nanoarchaeota archaeon]